MAKVVQVATRVSPEIRDRANQVFMAHGLDIPTAIRMFITTTAYEHRIPMSINSEVRTSNDKIPPMDRPIVYKQGATESMLPISDSLRSSAQPARINPSTGHILVTEQDSPSLQEWALYG
jgi:addiction module RelB/DinJ family antitoxin